MNIDEFQSKLDSLFDENRIPEVEPFLSESLTEAIQQDDTAAVVFILNEMVGFFRQVSEYDKAVLFGTKALQILENSDAEETLPYATTELNLATALRAAGRLDESLAYYVRVCVAYEKFFPADAFDFANLYNNMSLAYQEMGLYPAAVELLEKTMKIVLMYPEKRYELAVTHTNLGNSYLGIVKYIKNATDEEIQTAGLKGYDLSRIPEYPGLIVAHLEEAIKIFHERNENGSHLAAAVLGMAEILSIQDRDDEALEKYAQAMSLVQANVGRTDQYYRAKAGFDSCYVRVSSKESISDSMNNSSAATLMMKGADISRAWYEKRVLPMLQEKYSHLLPHMSIGLFGYGSDAYGFDDTVSRDHDWGPGVILLLDNDSDFDQYGQQIQNDLYSIMTGENGENPEFMGFTPDISSVKMARRGVFSMAEFFAEYIGLPLYEKLISDKPDISNDVFLSTMQYNLAAMTNGSIFHDGSGKTSMIRTKLSEYYPDLLRIQMLKQEIALFSQNGQYNYRRMKQRDEIITAQMLLDDALKNAIRIEYILHKKYQPHDKWLIRGLREFSNPDFENLLIDVKNAERKVPMINVTDAAVRPVTEALERIALYLEKEMIEQGLIKSMATYMEDIIGQLD